MSSRAFACLVVLLLGAASLSALALVPDQFSPVEQASEPTTAVGGPHNQFVSQTVTVGVRGRLHSISVPIGCADGILELEIQGVNADNQADGSVIRRRTYLATDLPTVVGPEYVPLNVGGATTFEVGDRFAIVLSNPTGSCGVMKGIPGDGYTGGTGWADADDGPIVPLGLGTGREDMPFLTTMRER